LLRMEGHGERKGRCEGGENAKEALERGGKRKKKETVINPSCSREKAVEGKKQILSGRGTLGTGGGKESRRGESF